MPRGLSAYVLTLLALTTTTETITLKLDCSGLKILQILVDPTNLLTHHQPMHLQQVSQVMSDIANHDHWAVYLIMSLCIIVYLLY